MFQTTPSKSKFPLCVCNDLSIRRQRELDRDELFERARAELLDQSAELSAVPPPAWEQRLTAELWTSTHDRVFGGIYLPAAALAHDDVGTMCYQ